MRYSIKSLLLLIAVVALSLLLIQRFVPFSFYNGASNDIGYGHSETFYYLNANGEEIGRLDVEINEKDTLAQPSWEASASNPPLSARDALIIAGRFVKNRFPKTHQQEWCLLSMNLTPLDFKKLKWCWIVRFEQLPANGTTTTYSPQLSVIVMMDGKILEPRDSNGLLIDGDKH